MTFVRKDLIYSQLSIFLAHSTRFPSKKGQRDLTTFTGPDGRRWRYARCPFGLNNSRSQLNLILSNLFSDKTRFHSLCCYVDDLCIYSNDWKSHVQQLELAMRTTVIGAVMIFRAPVITTARCPHPAMLVAGGIYFLQSQKGRCSSIRDRIFGL